ncbi:unnamed protein product [Lupinus luteus]|uniref:Uncharacterized protein n=1 Tax=Lupinus luteus TaxID=3873 RepID=A0AAV1WUD4_LUPLU
MEPFPSDLVSKKEYRLHLVSHVPSFLKLYLGIDKQFYSDQQLLPAANTIGQLSLLMDPNLGDLSMTRDATFEHCCCTVRATCLYWAAKFSRVCETGISAPSFPLLEAGSRLPSPAAEYRPDTDFNCNPDVNVSKINIFLS